MKELIQAQEKERLNSELSVFWNEIETNLPKSLEMSALGNDKVFRAFAIVYPKIREHLHKALLEAVIEMVEEEKNARFLFAKSAGSNRNAKFKTEGYHQALKKIQDKLKEEMSKI